MNDDFDNLKFFFIQQICKGQCAIGQKHSYM